MGNQSRSVRGGSRSVFDRARRLLVVLSLGFRGALLKRDGRHIGLGSPCAARAACEVDPPIPTPAGRDRAASFVATPVRWCDTRRSRPWHAMSVPTAPPTTSEPSSVRHRDVANTSRNPRRLTRRFGASGSRRTSVAELATGLRRRHVDIRRTLDVDPERRRPDASRSVT